MQGPPAGGPLLFPLGLQSSSKYTRSRGRRSRERTKPIGLFVGGIGRDHTFMVYDGTNASTLAERLGWYYAATYAPHAGGNLQAALGAA